MIVDLITYFRILHIQCNVIAIGVIPTTSYVYGFESDYDCVCLLA